MRSKFIVWGQIYTRNYHNYARKQEWMYFSEHSVYGKRQNAYSTVAMENYQESHTSFRLVPISMSFNNNE